MSEDRRHGRAVATPAPALVSPPPGPRRRRGRFARRFNDLELLLIVREVCALAALQTGLDPLKTTQVAYDAAREGSTFADTPRAFRIAAQLGAPWAKVVEVAHKRGRDFHQSLAALNRRGAKDVSEDEAVIAIASIARRLAARTLRPNDYDRELDLLIEEQRQAWLHGRAIADVFPSSSRIGAKFDWDELLAKAGLEPRPKQSPQSQRPQPPMGTWNCERCVQALLQALDDLARTMPSLDLTQRAYRRLAKGRDDLPPMSTISEQARRMGTSFSAVRDELVRWRLGDRDGEPDVLVRARHYDAVKPKPTKPLGLPPDRSWAAELLAAVRTCEQPARVGELFPRLGWTRDVTSHRLQLLAAEGELEMINLGKGRKSVRWQIAAGGAPKPPQRS